MIKKMLDADYFAMPGVSNSYLNRLAKCPAAALIETETTPSMALGSAAHCLILEGREEFYKRFAIAPECDKRTKDGKAEYSAFLETVGDKTVITLDQLETISGMAESIAEHPSAREILKQGQPEMAFTWTEDNVDCKGKADFIAPGYLVDLKTTTDSSEHQFSRSVVNFNYHQQFAFYRSGLAHNHVHPERFIIIAVESKPPYPCAVYELSDELLSWGEGSYKSLLKAYKACQSAQSFPAYKDAGIILLDVPQWAK